MDIVEIHTSLFGFLVVVVRVAIIVVAKNIGMGVDYGG